jgi:hypothetical protein
MFYSSSQATSREYGQSSLSVDALSDDLLLYSLKYFTPSKWIARIMVSWGIVTICTAAVTSYEGLIVVRIFLGIAEAGFFPGIMMYLCFCEYDERIRCRSNLSDVCFCLDRVPTSSTSCELSNTGSSSMSHT